MSLGSIARTWYSRRTGAFQSLHRGCGVRSAGQRTPEDVVRRTGGNKCPHPVQQLGDVIHHGVLRLLRGPRQCLQDVTAGLPNQRSLPRACENNGISAEVTIPTGSNNTMAHQCVVGSQVAVQAASGHRSSGRSQPSSSSAHKAAKKLSGGGVQSQL